MVKGIVGRVLERQVPRVEDLVIMPEARFMHELRENELNDFSIEASRLFRSWDSIRVYQYHRKGSVWIPLNDDRENPVGEIRLVRSNISGFSFEGDNLERDHSLQLSIYRRPVIEFLQSSSNLAPNDIDGLYFQHSAEIKNPQTNLINKYNSGRIELIYAKSK